MKGAVAHAKQKASPPELVEELPLPSVQKEPREAENIPVRHRDAGEAHRPGWIIPSLARALELQLPKQHHPTQKNCLPGHRDLGTHPNAMASFIVMVWGYQEG